MSAVTTSSLKRDLGLIAWQIRYEQRAYWRNRGRGIFTFVFPLMFLVIFASLNKGAHISSRGGIPAMCDSVSMASSTRCTNSLPRSCRRSRRG